MTRATAAKNASPAPAAKEKDVEEHDLPEFNELDAAIEEDVEDLNDHLGDGDDEVADEKLHNPSIQVSSFSDEPDTTQVDWSAIAAANQVAQDDAIAKAVAAAIEKLGLGKIVEPAPEPFVAPTYKYHFRNDVNPHVKIQAMDMSALDRGERPQDNPLLGHWYAFHVGHFQTNDENAARQLRWSMQNVPVDANGQTVGGNLAIYEDDNSVIYRCPDPECGFVTASPAGYKAHRRATHGEL